MSSLNRFEYETIVRHDDFVVRDHRVYDVRIMPGVTFLDMIVRVMESRGTAVCDFEIRDILFKEPVAVSEEYDKKVKLVFEKKDTFWTVLISSRKIKNREFVDDTWDENLEAKIISNHSAPTDIDIERIKKRATASQEIDAFYAFTRSVGIQHFDFMKATGTMFSGDGFMLAELSLGKLARKYLNAFYLHPVFLDASTLVALLFQASQNKLSPAAAEPRIPIYIRSVQVLAPLGERCFVHVETEPAAKNTNEINYTGLDIYNQDGTLAVSMKKLGAKRIRSQGQITRLTSEETTPVSVQKASEDRTINTDTGLSGTPAKAIEEKLRILVSEQLRLKPYDISVTSGFYEMGLDSNMLLKLVGKLEEILGEQLYPTLLFEYTSVSELTEYLEETFGDTCLNARAQTIQTPSGESASTVTTSLEAGMVYFKPDWLEVPLSGFEPEGGDLLLISEDDDLADQLAKRFELIRVIPSAEFSENGEGRYALNVLEPSHYERLFRELAAAERLPGRIVRHLFEKKGEALETKDCLYPMLFLVQALMARKPKTEIRLLSAGVFNARSPAHCMMEAMAGFGKSLYQENPRYVTRIMMAEPGTTPESLAQKIASEFQDKTQPVQQVRYHQDKRRVKTYRKFLPGHSAPDAVTFRKNGVYLITGGMGALGMLVAETLARDYKARLVLAGRSDLGEESKNILASMRRHGGDVIYEKADVSDLNAVRQLVLTIKNTFGALNGIIHSAGVIRDAFVINKKTEQMRDVTAPKISGTLNLDEATKDENLDFMVLFSSISGVLGNPGQCDYAFANAFMDNFARYREALCASNKRSGRTLSVKWPLWKDGGMQVNEMTGHLMQGMGLVPVSIDTGMEALAGGLAGNDSSFGFFYGDTEKIIPALKAMLPQYITPSALAAGSSGNVVRAPSSGMRSADVLPHKPETNDVAIIGVSGRYPMAEDIEQYWRNLKSGKDCISEVPKERWDHSRYFGDQLKWGGFIDGVDRFDPLFFNISPREAEIMDPQERLFLECVYATIEDAGYTPEALCSAGATGEGKWRMPGNIGVYAGVMFEEYQLYGAQSTALGMPLSLGGISASIANRVSYYFNFHGPSMTVDTMCSSSLTAIHLACQALRQGQCRMAIAGGVNVSVHPNKYFLLAMANFASTKGRCESFGKDGDGYVPGEGVGAVLLKPLTEAVRDRDRIYGIIRGSAVNHGGRASGFTVPNPVSQANVIYRAFEDAGVHPATVSYIEAHGTGTALGDPIEIVGLNKVFREFTQEKRFCAIGSVKSNIGHSESAAGIAALTKVLLQMKHKTLVPSLHSKTVNPHIDFENSPFVVQQQAADWHCPRVTIDGVEKTWPRISGISSFGAGGANAHVLIEEYKTAETSLAVQGPHVIVLSAKNKDRLRVAAQRLSAFLTEAKDLSLPEIAWTLQTGRRAMEERIAFVAENLDGLKNALSGFIGGEKQIEGLFSGNVRQNKGKAELLIEGEEGRAFVHHIVTKRKIRKIAQLWVSGIEIDWRLVHDNDTPARISLPTYPFARERYWIDIQEQQNPAVSHEKEMLHPMLGRNTSTFSEQRFTTVFSGEEFFLTDHRVQGQKVLPGVAYLEMARKAFELSSEAFTGELLPVSIGDVSWLKPVTLPEKGRSHEIHVVIHPRDDNTAFYKVYADTPEEAVYSQGKILSASGSYVEPETLDLEAIRKRLSPRALNPNELYQLLKEIGVDYGRGHRGIQELYAGENEALSRLELPDDFEATFHTLLLHPGIMDSALQTITALMLQDENASGLAMPFALDRLDISGACSNAMWAFARLAEDTGTTRKYDISLCTDSGETRVRFTGFSVRPAAVEALKHQTLKKAAAYPKSLSLTPHWRWVSMPGFGPPDTEKPLIVGEEEAVKCVLTVVPDADRLYLGDQRSIKAIEEGLSGFENTNHIIWNAPLSPDQEKGVFQLFRLVKALLSNGAGRRPMQLTVLTRQTQVIGHGEPHDPAHAGVFGFVGSLAKEYLNWKIRLVDLPERIEPHLVESALRLPRDEVGQGWAIRNGQWYRQALLPLAEPYPTHVVPEVSCREKGVYVVIGGAGGVGRVWTQYVAETYQAQVIWLGRRGLTEEIRSRMQGIEPAPLYMACDASDPSALEETVRQIKKQFPVIHGVVHSAIVLNDQFLAKMDEQAFKTVVSAKIDTGMALAKAFEKEGLDFVLFFSSLISFFKAPGQSNYACGSCFIDSFAQRMNRLWACPVKVMNWGYWGSVGIVTDEIYKERMAQIGIGSIEPAEGMKAVEALLSSPLQQMAFVNVTQPVFEAQAEARVFISPSWLPVLSEALTPETEVVLSGAGPHDKKSLNALTSLQATVIEYETVLYGILASHLKSRGLLENKSDAEKQLPQRFHSWYRASLTLIGQHFQTPEDMLNQLALPDQDTLLKQWKEKKDAWLKNPVLKPQVVLLDATLPALFDILSEKAQATDFLFPEGSMNRLEGLYRNNPLADYFNAVLVESLKRTIEKRLGDDPDTAIRILEIGAGTGGTSSQVFAMLKPFEKNIEEYCYTDISKAFLFYAESTWKKEAPYLKTGLFNVEQPLIGQDIPMGQYDIVIAANVLHATALIHNTLQNTKAVLKQNGMLFLNELSMHGIFTHLTFGLLDGWWLFGDPELRMPGGPGLSTGNWKSVLGEEGFFDVQCPTRDYQTLGQQIIIARSNGVIRQTLADHQMRAPRKPVKGVSTNKKPESSYFQENYDLLGKKATAYFIELAETVLKVPSGRLLPDVPLGEYGIDSILIGQMVSRLSGVLSDVNTTLFFEYQTIDELVAYFVETRPEELAQLVGMSETPVTGTAERTPIVKNRPAARAHRFQARRQEKQSQKPPIAIIGLSGRYPMAENVDAFWENLKAGRNCISEIPENRWNWQDFYDPEKGKPGKMYTRWGGFIDGIDLFDPLFFKISPLEAEIIDPQERLFLEQVHAAVEDAGYSTKTLSESRKVGIFAGVMNADLPMGASHWSVANRVSYTFDFRGPSMAVDTACSSSLVAIHLALESIHSGSSEIAVAGGVNLILSPLHYQKLTAMNMLSTSDECRAFGEHADGFVDSEGVGAVVLKPLDRAVIDGDHIYGIIKGSMINAGGKTNGYTVPNPKAQQQVVRDALERAEVNAAHVSYVEAHGTGTILGDPIEISSLAKAFRHDTDKIGYCAIGSSKSNIGHAESAAGIAALTKVLLQMKHNMLVPSLHSETLNPNIDFEKSPFVVQQGVGEWQRPVVTIDGVEKTWPRIAGISSFGAGGANAHVILEEYEALPETRIACETETPQVFVLSARNEERLKVYAESMLAFLERKTFNKPVDADQDALLNRLYQDLSEIAAGILGVNKEEIDLTGNVYENGFDLAEITTFCGRVNDRYDLETQAPLFSEYPSIEAFGGYLFETYGERLDKHGKPFVFTGGHETETLNLTDIAWTLQTGREAMDERLAIISESVEDLSEKLGRFVRGEKDTEDVYTGHAGQDKNKTDVFIDGPEGKEFIRLAIANRNMRKIAGLWVSGIDIDWRFLHEDETPVRLSLPTYPFARKRCWAGGTELKAQASLNTEEKRPVPETVFFEPRWEMRPIDAYDVPSGTILLIDCGHSLAKKMGRKGRIIQSNSGDEYHFHKLLSELETHGEKPFHVVYCLPEKTENHISASVDEMIECLLHPLFFLTKALMAHNFPEKIRLLLFGWEQDPGMLHCLSEALSGFVKTLQQEYPKIIPKFVIADRSSDKDKRAEIIWRELQESTVFDGEVRYRENWRQVKGLHPLPLPAMEKKALPFKKMGVYLITGGTGGLGLIFARYLAVDFQARLVLTSRSAPDVSTEQKFEAMRNAGAHVTWIRADVTDQVAVEALIHDIKDIHGELNGIFHSAGVIRDALIQNKTVEEMTQVIAPKIAGTIYLDEATKNEPLDFMVLFSSMSGVSGNSGQSDYAFANAFMDNYASYRDSLSQEKRRSGRSLSVNWPLWKEGGMKPGREIEKLMKRLFGMVPLETDEGIAALVKGLASDATQLAVFYGYTEKPQRGTGKIHQKPAEGKPENEALLEKTERFLMKEIMELLKLEPGEFDADQEFFNYGFDSITFTRFANTINEKLDLDIHHTEFMEYPSVLLFSEYLVETYHHDTLKERLDGFGGPKTVWTMSAPSDPAGADKTDTTRTTEAAWEEI